VNVGGGPPTQPTNTPTTCIVGAKFIADGNPLNGSQIQPGTSFTKSWQVQNNGTCIWIASYGIQKINNNTLNAPSPSSVPLTQPNQTATISLNMVAPQQPGTYNSVWQLRASNGVLFGSQLTAQIVVPQAGCSGQPQFTNFSASPQTIQPGQSSTLTWGPVYN